MLQNRAMRSGVVRRTLVTLALSTVGAAGCRLAGAGDPGAGRPSWREPVTGMEFVELPAGRFRMGSPPTEPGHESQERLHDVVLTRSFWLGRTEVTQGQWKRVMGDDPSHFRDLADDLPVERVNLFDVERFLARLAELSPGSRFRLPTEAEWEYACRAGTTTAYPGGDRLSTDQGNYDGRYPLPGQPPGEDRERPTPVASFAPNAWGLFDMNGNVWEWTADEHCPYPEGESVDPLARCASPLHVIRGGSWVFNADSARCAVRYTHAPKDLGFSLGFRAVRELAVPAPTANGR